MAKINRFFGDATFPKTIFLSKTFEEIEMIGAWNGRSFFFWRDFFQNIQITFCCIISFCKSNSSLLAWLMKKNEVVFLYGCGFDATFTLEKSHLCVYKCNKNMETENKYRTFFTHCWANESHVHCSRLNICESCLK